MVAGPVALTIEMVMAKVTAKVLVQVGVLVGVTVRATGPVTVRVMVPGPAKPMAADPMVQVREGAWALAIGLVLVGGVSK